jgi:hypothetical protein
MRRAIKSQTLLTLLLAGAAAVLSACSPKIVVPAHDRIVTPARVLKPVPPRPPTIYILASPSNINEGEFTILFWRSERATSVRIDNGVGVVEIAGKHLVAPSTSTTYKATAAGPGGQSSATIRVVVNRKVHPSR